MKNYIDFQKVKCKDCFRCLRECPVKSIRFTNHQAEVIEDDCILCGNCYLTCPQGAKEIRSDINVVRSLFKRNIPVYATVAPSFVANYRVNFDSLREALIKLGFKDAFETAIGAAIVRDQYEKIIDDDEQKIVISTCCPTVNMLIQKYYPSLTGYMAKVLSPASSHAKMIKQEYHNCAVVFIGPCLSKKEEVDENNSLLDAAITFEELSLWLKREKVSFDKIENHEKKGKTRLFPISGGIINSFNRINSNYKYISIDGLDNCKNILDEIKKGLNFNCFIEMSACKGSCICGPGMDKEAKNYIQNYTNIIESSSNNDFNYNDISINKNFDEKNRVLPEPSNELIKMILARLGKNKPEDELNCGSCGYNTCKDKAIALYYGRTEPSMCLPYLKSKAESFRDDIVDHTPNGIIVLNENLDVELINNSACKILNIEKQKDIIGQPIIRVIDPTIYAKSIQTKANQSTSTRFLAEYDKYIEETIVYDSKYNIVISIMRDITLEILNKQKKDKLTEETLSVTDKVIEKQMRTVQEIAMLLGETTAETKVALEKLKESLNDK